mmetsp:Transcript_11026/g.24973  ORF Transcript_11026/g.24973 Transcript_11026/m.24973 type:complete len:214 (-) Transcript_11026:1213-1854(-)
MGVGFAASILSMLSLTNARLSSSFPADSSTAMTDALASTANDVSTTTASSAEEEEEEEESGVGPHATMQHLQYRPDRSSGRRSGGGSLQISAFRTNSHDGSDAVSLIERTTYGSTRSSGSASSPPGIFDAIQSRTDATDVYTSYGLRFNWLHGAPQLTIPNTRGGVPGGAHCVDVKIGPPESPLQASHLPSSKPAQIIVGPMRPLPHTFSQLS